MAQRKEVLDVLKKVEPALSTKDLIPVFACLCFNGTTVTAFDDVVALQYPFDFGFKGAVRGRVLIDFLASSRAKEVEVEGETDGVINIKAGRAKLNTPLLGTDDFLFKRPKMEQGHTLKVGDDFLSALGRAMISMGRDPSHPFRLGVTVSSVSSGDDGEKSGLLFYSSDNKSATQVFYPTKEGDKVELVTILPPRFCELISEIGKADKLTSITLNGDWVEATFTSGLRLFSKTVQGAELKTFRKVFKGMEEVGTVIDIPKGLDKCLERALVVAKFAKEPFTAVKVKGDQLLLHTSSESAGEVKDRITIDTHGPAELWVAPELLARVLPLADKFALIPEQCVLFKGKHFTHVVTVVEGAGGSE